MANLLIFPLVACIFLALFTIALRRAWLNRFVALLAAFVVFFSGVAIASQVLSHGPILALHGILRTDALSAFMLILIGSVGVTSTWGGLASRGKTDHNAVGYPALLVTFLFAMSLAVLADNLGVIWVAIEATTITTAFLVGHHRTRQSLEAAWKYVVLGSVGVAIALLGIVVLYAATVASGKPTLSWVVLVHSNLSLDPGLVKMAAGLTLLGFATKAGLAPMHSWLPDAHSQAPSEVSGLMSGVLLSVAFYGILRVQTIANAIIGSHLMRGLLITSALLSIAEAGALILRQRDLKRMLAYSSIEHMGIVALAAGIGGPIALGAALLHMFGHGLAKSTAFILSGRIIEIEQTNQITQIKSIMTRRPGLASPFLASIAALIGMPPFTLFFTEVAIVYAGFQHGLSWIIIIAIVLILFTFIGLVRNTLEMSFGAELKITSYESKDSRPVDRSWHGTRLPLILALSVTIIIAFLPGPFLRLLLQAIRILSGGP